jgi:hypothetical protein
MIIIYTPDDFHVDVEFSGEINDIDIYRHMSTSKIQTIRDANFIIYIENKNKWKILKNRYLFEDKKTKEILNLLNINV